MRLKWINNTVNSTIFNNININTSLIKYLNELDNGYNIFTQTIGELSNFSTGQSPNYPFKTLYYFISIISIYFLG